MHSIPILPLFFSGSIPTSPRPTSERSDDEFLEDDGTSRRCLWRFGHRCIGRFDRLSSLNTLYNRLVLVLHLIFIPKTFS